MSALDVLSSLEPPWVHLVVLDDGESLDLSRLRNSEFFVAVVDGRRGRTKLALIDEFGLALCFPSGVGRNWDAFEEVLNDLEWLPASGYVIVVTHADELLADEPDAEYHKLIDILTTTGKEWATGDDGYAQPPRPVRPFHVVLMASRTSEGKRRDWRAPLLTA